jgi:hypothetical protein
MPGIHTRQEKPAPGLDFSDLVIPDENDISTGTYTLGIEKGALGGKTKIISAVFNKPHFQVEVSIDPETRMIRAAVGPTDAPITSRQVMLPDDLDRKAAHTLVVQFKDWSVTEVRIGNRRLL